MASKREIILKAKAKFPGEGLKTKDYEVGEDGWAINGWGKWVAELRIKPLKIKLQGEGGTRSIAREALLETLEKAQSIKEPIAEEK